MQGLQETLWQLKLLAVEAQLCLLKLGASHTDFNTLPLDFCWSQSQ